MSTREKLLAEILRYIKRKKMSASQFGKSAGVGSAFVGRLQAEKNPRSDTVDRVRAWMGSNP